MSPEPHFDEEALQKATDREAARFPQRFESQDPLNETEIGGNAPESMSPTLPDGKSPAFYAEGGKMLVDENIAKRQIRANKARHEAGLPPIDLE